MYIEDSIDEYTEVIKIDRCKIINTNNYFERIQKLEISAVYRSHEIPKTEFIFTINEFLKDEKSIQNHILIGDFNIDIINIDNYS